MMSKYFSMMRNLERATGTKFKIVSQEYISRMGREFGVNNAVGMHDNGIAYLSGEYLSRAPTYEAQGLIAHESAKNHGEIPKIANLLRKLGYNKAIESSHIKDHVDNTPYRTSLNQLNRYAQPAF